jgi:MoxR-like ATPase
MRIELGYPNRAAERELLEGKNRHSLIDALSTALEPELLADIQRQITQVHSSPALLNYLQDLINYSRDSDDYHCGLSPRAGLALLSAAKSWAYLDGRNAVLPDDIQAVLPAVAGHRLRSGSSHSESIVAPLLNNVAVS